MELMAMVTMRPEAQKMLVWLAHGGKTKAMLHHLVMGMALKSHSSLGVEELHLMEPHHMDSKMAGRMVGRQGTKDHC